MLGGLGCLVDDLLDDHRVQVGELLRETVDQVWSFRLERVDLLAGNVRLGDTCRSDDQLTTYYDIRSWDPIRTQLR